MRKLFLILSFLTIVSCETFCTEPEEIPNDVYDGTFVQVLKAALNTLKTHIGAAGGGTGKLTEGVADTATGINIELVNKMAELRREMDSKLGDIPDPERLNRVEQRGTENTDKIGTFETRIGNSEKASQKNTTDIGTNKTSIEKNTADIGTLKTDVADTKKKVEEHEPKIKKNEEDIKKNREDFDALDAEVTRQDTRINQNKTDIGTNKTNIQSNKDNISRNISDINGIRSGFDSHKREINNSIFAINRRVDRNDLQVENLIASTLNDYKLLHVADNVDTVLCMSTGTFSTSLGYLSSAMGYCSSAIGQLNYAYGDYSNAFGYGNSSKGAHSNAFGGLNIAQGSYSNAFGGDNITSGDYSSSFGSSNISSGTYSFTIGYNCDASSTASASIGNNAVCSAPYSYSFGNNSNVEDRNTYNVYYASSQYNYALGNGASVLGHASYAIGNYASIYHYNSAIANQTLLPRYCYAIGNSASITGQNIADSIIVGGNSGIWNEGSQLWDNNYIFGENNYIRSPITNSGGFKNNYFIGTHIKSVILETRNSFLLGNNIIFNRLPGSSTYTENIYTLGYDIEISSTSSKNSTNDLILGSIGVNGSSITAITIGSQKNLMADQDNCMVIMGGTGVGIETLTPTTRLDVNGGIKCTTMTVTTSINVPDLSVTYGISAATGVFSGAISAATLDTGQGANELYDMDQNVQTTDIVQHSRLNLIPTLTGDTTLQFWGEPTGGTTYGLNLKIDSNSGIIKFDPLHNNVNITGITMNRANGNVGIGTTNPLAKLEVNGYTKLGSDAPSIKCIKLSMTTASAEGGTTTIAHGLTSTKILSVTPSVQYSAGNFVPAQYTNGAEYQFDYSYGTTDITIYLHATNSGNILEKPVTTLIWYEE